MNFHVSIVNKTKTNQTVLFTLLLRNTSSNQVRKIENLKVIENTLPDKSGNPESLKK